MRQCTLAFLLLLLLLLLLLQKVQKVQVVQVAHMHVQRAHTWRLALRGVDMHASLCVQSLVHGPRETVSLVAQDAKLAEVAQVAKIDSATELKSAGQGLVEKNDAVAAAVAAAVAVVVAALQTWLQRTRVPTARRTGWT